MALTNPFGYFRFDDLPVGETYGLTVSAKRFTFAQPSQVIFLNEDLTDVSFTSEQ